MEYAIIILAMAILARLSGMNLPRFVPAFLPEFLFGACFGATIFVTSGNWWLATIAGIWSYAWMETGHGTVLQWGDKPWEAIGRKQFLTPVVDYLAKVFRFQKGSKDYCIMFMGIKGLLIGLPVAPIGLTLMVFWPLAYDIGHRFKSHAMKEFMSGAFAGWVVTVYLLTHIQ